MSFYSLLLPPPNLTGALHLGHLWNIIIQDFRYKWEEIRRTAVYWAIGVDHAGLSFQSKFDALFGDKVSRKNEEKYLFEMHKYANSLKEHILSQFSLISSSLPINESRYTLESQSKELVLNRFTLLFSQGLIYKKKKLVNWDIQLQEVLADCELEYKESISKLYYLKYQLVDSPKEYLVVATSRPETIFGDVAVFVNPEDERYKDLLNKKVYIPGVKREIPILSDSSIDMNFGTAAMKCTPAHDSLDWDLGEKYSLESITVFDEKGILTKNALQFSGRDRLEAKEEIVDWLQSLELVEKIEEYQTKLAFSEKSHSLTEKIVTEQWFLSSSVLAKKLAVALREKRFNFQIFPASQEERLLTYLDNMEDWCLSRQIPWGIKVPIVFDKLYGKYRINQKVSNLETEVQEDIVLDTWFSSSLWPFIVFEGKPFQREKFFPFNTLVSGKDILLPWVSRMLFLSFHLSAKLPFRSVFLHGLLKNDKGEKMSKSLGNGILPEELYKKYSPDVVRVAFLMNTNFDRDIRYSELIFQKASTFLHKLEHISKFFFQKINPELNQELLFEVSKFNFTELQWAERWIFRNFNLLGEKIDSLYAQHDYFELTREIIRFYSEDLSNKFLELFKLERNLNANTIKFLAYIWEVATRILYPLVPDFAEKSYREIFSRELPWVFPNKFYPEKISNDSLRYEWFFEYMKEVRRIYQALSLDYSKTVKLNIVLGEKARFTSSEIEDFKPYFKKLNHILSTCTTSRNISHYPTIKIKNLYFELDLGSFSREKYSNFIKKEISKYSFEIERSKKILSREAFRDNAPPELIKKENSKYKEYLSMHKFYTELELQIR